MTGLLEIGATIISRATRRAELAANNIANVATPGFQARRHASADVSDDFATLLDHPTASDTSVDPTGGKMINTGGALDFAVESGGYFKLRSGDDVFYTRDGQFRRDGDGRLVTATGMALQSDGGDVTVGAGRLSVLRDGTIIENDAPVARIAVFEPGDGARFRIAENGLLAADRGEVERVADPQLRQGMLQASNVSSADEMLSLMAALRGAETGQRVVQVYDDLIGRALTAFGQA